MKRSAFSQVCILNILSGLAVPSFSDCDIAATGVDVLRWPWLIGIFTSKASREDVKGEVKCQKPKGSRNGSATCFIHIGSSLPGYNVVATVSARTISLERTSGHSRWLETEGYQK